MCGRFSLFAPREDVEERLGATFAGEYEPRYNAAPGQALPVVTDTDPGVVRRMEWGLVPPWADDRSEFGLINARAETLAERPSFRDAVVGRSDRDEDAPGAPVAGRCLVPADGFYEWAETDDGKRPYRVTRADGGVFAMAGLWTRWRPPQRQTGLGEFGASTGRGDGPGGDEADAPVVETFAIVTTEPDETVGDLHDRMAVVLDPDEDAAWLHGDAAGRESLLAPYDGPTTAYPVSTAVNDPANDSPAVVEPADGRPPADG